MKRIIALSLAAVVLFGCSGESSDTVTSGEVVLYSGRSQSLVEPLLQKFEKETGIKVNIKYGKSAQLALAIQEEGDKSPADVFWSQRLLMKPHCT